MLLRESEKPNSVTEKYPFNLNSSPKCIAGVKSHDATSADIASWALMKTLDRCTQFGPGLWLSQDAY